MIKFVKNQTKKISCILVYSLDRFSRTGDNAIYISSQLKKQGISILAVTQPIDVSTVSGVLQQNIQFIFSKYDNDLRREKSVTGMREKLLRGEWIGVVPRGYSYTHAYRSKNQIIVINDEGKFVKQAFMMKLKEDLTNKEIAERLCKVGFKICHKKLSELFRNPFYCGYISHNLLEGQLVKGKHPALITEQLFLAVNNLLEKNAQGFKWSKEDEFVPMKRFIKCADCGSPFTGYLRKKKLKNGKVLHFYYYKCNRPGCKCNRSVDKMHYKFKALLERYQIKPEFIPVIKKQMEKTFTEISGSEVDNQKSLKIKFHELQEKLSKLEERFAFGEIDRELYDKLAPKLKKEISEKEEELQRMEVKLSNPSELIEKCVVIASQLANLWVNGDSEEKKMLQNMLFPEGILFDKENDDYRPSNINVVLELIAELSANCNDKKKGLSEKNSEQSRSVARGGS
ncbi:MAG: recombinase family protein [Cytophagaceae bacterium]|nr:recombinase family protein [Cytophagaceae bacterium]